ncbi:MAG: RNA methyltransferase [Alphaproteobacteria bacterium]|jgi:tRNA/rRNA methyltransferase|nr:RNA methyltransferase [Alphaproteobacteria bacterium]
MAGTDHTKTTEPALKGLTTPAVILVEPQLGENIGMAARAMLNCGLTDLRLVAPRDGWPNKDALAASAGAVQVIEAAQVFETTTEAVADLNFVLATTARHRDMTTRIVTPHQAAAEIHAVLGEGENRAGILFGREAKGLKNDDVTQADAIVMVPVNPGFSSLNLAQAVFAVCHEWYLAAIDEQEPSGLAIPKETRPASKDELNGMLKHLGDELEDAGFFHVEGKRPVMERNLRNMFQRANLTEQEIRTLRGVISSLTRTHEKK